MNGKIHYYIYAILLLNLLVHSFVFSGLKGASLISEAALFAIFIISSFYIVYAFETKKKKPYSFALVFFSISTLNAVVVYFLTKKLDASLLALISLLGIYVTSVIIPEGEKKKRAKMAEKPKFYYEEKGTGGEEKEAAGEEEAKTEPMTPREILKDMIEKEPSPPQQEGENIPTEESQIIIEEIKPVDKEKEEKELKKLRQIQKGKKNIPKKRRE